MTRSWLCQYGFETLIGSRAKTCCEEAAGQTLYIDEEAEALPTNLVSWDVGTVISIHQSAPGSAEEDTGLEPVSPAI